jgi:hypothetical protein
MERRNHGIVDQISIRTFPSLHRPGGANSARIPPVNLEFLRIYGLLFTIRRPTQATRMDIIPYLAADFNIYITTTRIFSFFQPFVPPGLTKHPGRIFATEVTEDTEEMQPPMNPARPSAGTKCIYRFAG